MTESGRGRPRDAGARAAALQAARDLLQSEGYEGLSLDDVAARAGVSKQSLYRWWGSKSELIVQTVLEGYVAASPLVVPNTDDALRDLRSLIQSLVESLSLAENAPLIRALVAVAATDEGAAGVLWDRFTGPFRQAIDSRVAAGVRSGQFRAGLSSSVAAEAAIGAALFLVLARQPIRADYSSELTDLLLNGMTAGAA